MKNEISHERGENILLKVSKSVREFERGGSKHSPMGDRLSSRGSGSFGGADRRSIGGIKEGEEDEEEVEGVTPTRRDRGSVYSHSSSKGSGSQRVARQNSMGNS